MTAHIKVLAVIGALAALNAAIFVAKLELQHALNPIVKALGS